MDRKKIIELAIPYFEVMCPRLGGNDQIEERDRMLRDFIGDSQMRYGPDVTYTYYPEWSVVVYGMSITDVSIEGHVSCRAKGDEEPEEKDDLLQSFYLDCWKTALLDGARDYLRIKLQEEYSDRYVSVSYGPGFHRMGMEVLPEMMKLIDTKSIGLSLFHGSLNPAKSCVGFYRIQDVMDEEDEKDCESCLSGGKNCIFCKGYKNAI